MAEVWNPPPFDDISTSELVTAAYLNKLGNSLRFLKEVAYTSWSSNVSVTATTEGTANSLASTGAITYENVPHLIEVFSPKCTPPASGVQMFVTLYDSTTVIGRFVTAEVNATGAIGLPFYVGHRLVPSAASHTYNVKAHVISGTGTMAGGAGGSAAFLPGFIRITRVPT